MTQHTSTLVRLCLLLSLLYCAPQASGSEKGVGVRAGLGWQPDQGVVGVQFVFGKTLKFARFTPSFDIGFGDDVKTFTFNGDFRLILLTPPKSEIAFFGAAGPTVTVWNPETGSGDTEIGLSLAAGARLPLGKSNHYTFETRFGISDVPELRILIGVLFGSGSS